MTLILSIFANWVKFQASVSFCTETVLFWTWIRRYIFRFSERKSHERQLEKKSSRAKGICQWSIKCSQTNEKLLAFTFMNCPTRTLMHFRFAGLDGHRIFRLDTVSWPVTDLRLCSHCVRLFPDTLSKHIKPIWWGGAAAVRVSFLWTNHENSAWCTSDSYHWVKLSGCLNHLASVVTSINTALPYSDTCKCKP